MKIALFKNRVFLPFWYFVSSIVLLLGIAFVFESNDVLDSARRMMGLIISDVENVLKDNKKSTYTIQLDSDAQAIAKANAFSYMISLKPSLVGDAHELEKIRRLLDVDELHVTDSNGIIVGSTMSSYLGYDFASDPQSKEFMLAIYYKDFELAQKPMPKGIDKVMFQYAGVARIDNPGIVQIGYKPERVENVMKTVDISNIAKNWRIGLTGQVMIADLDGRILSTFDGKFLGRKLNEHGFPDDAFNGAEGAFPATVLGQRCYVLYQVYEKYMIIGILPEKEIYANRNSSFTVLFLMGMCTIILAGVIGSRSKES